MCDDLAVRPVEGSDFAVGRAGRPDAGGVVSRPGLVELLQMSGRVTVMSASAGSGKTVLLRFWISEASRIRWIGPLCGVMRSERSSIASSTKHHPQPSGGS